MSSREGAEQAFRGLVEARWQRWYDLAVTVTADEHRSRAAVLATFIHLDERWDDVESAPTDAGLRHLVSLLRPGTQVEAAPDEDSPADPFEDETARTRRRLLTAYRGLDIESRIALGLRCVDDLTDDEIARATGESGDQVARRIDSALDVVAVDGPDSWGRARVEAELRDAVRSEAAQSVADENPWSTTDLAIRRSRRRRRRVNVVVVAAVTAVAVGVVAVAVTQQPDQPQPQPRPGRRPPRLHRWTRAAATSPVGRCEVRWRDDRICSSRCATPPVCGSSPVSTRRRTRSSSIASSSPGMSGAAVS
ncbi:RNA polymerase sigma factor [Luteipulveratus halotolerans]|uniref:RNA polymerase sigma factor n=1 Tax=Luteipulveratus halotolerans TaxID=1631356 RepID=UPI0012F79F10|nr:hypothetical protein [Luteipulveratus halotolerans]